MKKTITTLALSLTLGLAISQISEAGWGKGLGNGPGSCGSPSCAQSTTADNEAFQEFLAETETLRTDLFEKRSEYFEIMRSGDVDKDEAQVVWSEMFDLKKQIQEKATALGIEPGAGGRGGCGGGPAANASPDCNGSGCGNLNNQAQL